MSEDRANLARQQHAALQSILSPQKSPAPPPGLDPTQLARTAETLAQKRRRELSLCIPQLTAHLAEKFPALFTTFAATHCYPTTGGPRADAANFARYLLKLRPFPTLSPTALREILLFRARTGPALQLHKIPRALYLTLRTPSRIRIYQLYRRYSP